MENDPAETLDLSDSQTVRIAEMEMLWQKQLDQFIELNSAK